MEKVNTLPEDNFEQYHDNVYVIRSKKQIFEDVSAYFKKHIWQNDNAIALDTPITGILATQPEIALKIRDFLENRNGVDCSAITNDQLFGKKVARIPAPWELNKSEFKFVPAKYTIGDLVDAIAAKKWIKKTLKLHAPSTRIKQFMLSIGMFSTLAAIPLSGIYVFLS